MSQLPSECPVCGSNQFDESLEAFDRVCDECRFVIRTDTDFDVLLWNDNNESQDTDHRDWLEVCRVRNATEQRVAEAFNILEEVGSSLDLCQEIRREAADFYCEAFKAGTTDGRETASIVAVCLRIVSLQLEHPIPSNRLIEVSDIDQKKFRLSHTAIQDDLEVQTKTPDPEAYVSFLSVVLDLDDAQEKAVEQLLTDVTGEPSLIGKDPVGIAAAGVYLVQDDWTQAAIAEAAGISTETIRQRTNQLEEFSNNG